MVLNEGNSRVVSPNVRETSKIVNHVTSFCIRKLLISESYGWLISVFFALLFCVQNARAQDGYWVNGSGGNWSSAGNWDSADGIAAGADSTAYFGFGPEGVIGPNASFTVSGGQTIGNLFFTSQGGSGNWTFNAGSGGSIILDNTFGPAHITVTSPGLQVALNAPVGGDVSVQKNGVGTLVMGGQDTYSGGTLVTGGGLQVNGALAGGGVEVTNGTLGGSGIINGPVTMDSGGTLSLGNSSGPLTINNLLVLQSGSSTYAVVGGSGNPLLKGLTGVTYGGTLIVSNIAGNLSLGQSFSIFGAAAASGNFSSIVPSPGPWMRWKFDPSSGQMFVVSSASQPRFAGFNSSGGKMAFALTNGPPGSACYILATTNLSLPMSAWTRLSTNTFDMSGNCNLQNASVPNGPGQVYLTAFVIPTP